MSERVLDAPLPHPVWLILDREDQLGASVDGALGHNVRIWYVQADPHGRATQRRWAHVAHPRRLVHDTEFRTADREEDNDASPRLTTRESSCAPNACW